MSGSLQRSGLTRVGATFGLLSQVRLPAHARDYCRSSSASSSLLWIVRPK